MRFRCIHRALKKPILFLTTIFTLLFISSIPVSATEKDDPDSGKNILLGDLIEAPESLSYDPLVQEMIDLVMTDTVRTYIEGLTGVTGVLVGGSPYTITTRYSMTEIPISKTTQYVYENFLSLGLTVDYHNYSLPNAGTRRNVIAEQPGKSPSCIYIVGAHLDDLSESQYRYSLAPGADDNASGSTAILVAADILSQYEFICTIRYALFTGEEQGSYGSDDYAAKLADGGINIGGYLNLDMISYNSDSSPIVDLHTRPMNSEDIAIAYYFTGVVGTYSLGLTPNIKQDGMEYSDHASFWLYGYPAILAIEDSNDETPYYHTIDDEVHTLDFRYFINFIKAAVGATAVMAGPVHETFFSLYLPTVGNHWDY